MIFSYYLIPAPLSNSYTSTADSLTTTVPRDFTVSTLDDVRLNVSDSNETNMSNMTTEAYYAVTTQAPIIILPDPVCNKSQSCTGCWKPLVSSVISDCGNTSCPDPCDVIADLACGFDDGCGCGYTYGSSNAHDFWRIRQVSPDQDNNTVDVFLSRELSAEIVFGKPIDQRVFFNWKSS